MIDDATRVMQFLFALRKRGVTDARVLAAMEKVDRGRFIEGHFEDRAYHDLPLPIACGQTISQPSVVGLMTQALAPGPRDKVHENGTGSGYQAAVLAQLNEGGVMVLPVGQSDTVQSLIKVTRTPDGFDYEELLPVRFVPLLEGIADS